MRPAVVRSLITSAVLSAVLSAVVGVVVGVSAVTAAAAGRPAFTLRDASMRVLSGRLFYEVTICTPVKSTLTLQGTFTAAPRGRGAPTIAPGSTQYQSKGCWPAFVSAPIARSAGACQPTSCAAVSGRRYVARVRITDEHPHQSRQAPRRQAVA